MKPSLLQTTLLACLFSSSITVANAQNTVDKVLGNLGENYRADDVPAGEQGRYYIPGSAAGKDNISPSSFSQSFRSSVSFNPEWSMSCGDMSFYSNYKQEIARLKYQLKNSVKKAEAAAMATVSSAIGSFQQYLLSKINPTLSQLSLKNLDEYLNVFKAEVKSCQDYEKDVANGKNPLSEIARIAIGDQWETTIGLVNAGSISLDEAKEEMTKEAQKRGVEMADGKRYGGKSQEPINITKSLLTAGMNLIMARGDKSQWDKKFSTTPKTVRDNPILREFKSAGELNTFVEDIYGSTEKNISTEAKSNLAVNTTSGRGYEKKYAEYRNEYIAQLRKYVNREIDRPTFEKNTGAIIPPAEINDMRIMPPYEKAVEIEQRGQQLAIKRIKESLIFAKQALKTGIYAPDMQNSSMFGMAQDEYKKIYYRIMDDLSEISQRAYQ